MYVGGRLYKFKDFKGLAILALGLAACLTQTSCNRKKVQENFLTECVLPGDQSSSVGGRWPITPILVAYADGFTEQEVAQMSLGLQSWNRFYETSKSYPLFDDGSPNYRRTSGSFPSSPCSYSLIQNNQYVAPVIIYKESLWPYTPAAIAVTTTCPVNGPTMPSYFMGAIQLNYQYFFSGGLPVPDIQSIVLHELGHLGGLKHSCEFGSQTPGMPDCNNGSLNPEYRGASLYPKFSWNGQQGEVRRSLNSNDQGRMNCVY